MSKQIKCITCDKFVIISDPFETGRCERCFDEYMRRPENKGLTNDEYWNEEDVCRRWYVKSRDDKLRETVKLPLEVLA